MTKLSLAEIEEQFKNQRYIAGENIVYAVYTVLALEKPLLVEGPAGVGKTELAKAMASILDAELVRMQCYEGIDASKTLYEINYPKQLLYQNILKGNLDEIIVNKNFSEAVEAINNEAAFYGKDFIIERPVLKCMNPDNNTKKVLLIDEIDKTDSEMEALLLEPLSDYSISIPEYKTVKCDENNKPLIILTSNGQRELSEALKRRCVYLYIDYPSIEMESEILRAKANVDYDFAKGIATLVSKIRKIDLKQQPSIAESVEWCNILHNYLGCTDLTELTSKSRKTMMLSLKVLLKNRRDIDTIKARLSNLI